MSQLKIQPPLEVKLIPIQNGKTSRKTLVFIHNFYFLNFSIMVASIKSKFGMHIKLTKCHLINI